MSEYIPEGNLFGLSQTPPNLLRVAFYGRKSNETEAECKSVDQQIKFCYLLATAYGFSRQNISEFREPDGVRGEWFWRDPEGHNPPPYRPELTRLMEDVNAGKIDVIVMWRSDRLIRDNGVGDAIAKVLRAKQVRLMCGGRDFGLDSASGLYQFNIEAANNRRHRDQTSEDVRRNAEFRAMAGLFTRCPSCYGFRSKGKGTQAVDFIDAELRIVRRVFVSFVLGEDDKGPMTITGIASLLMKEGIKISVGAKGHRAKDPTVVRPSHIKSILRNCMYVGRFRHHGQEYDCKALLRRAHDGSGRLETAIPEDLYEAAQEKLRLTTRPGRRNLNADHLLSGLLVCAYCGRPLHPHGDNRYSRPDGRNEPVISYVCNNRKPPFYCRPYGMKILRESVLDEWVLKELCPLIMLEIQRTMSASGREGDERLLAELERQIADLIANETVNLRNMVGVLDREQVARVAADFRAERQLLERKASEIRSRIEKTTELPDLSADALSEMPRSAIKDALRRTIQWIAIGNEGLVVLTALGTYIAAKVTPIPSQLWRVAGDHSTLCPPEPGVALQCLDWFPSPEDFIKGRHHYMGHRADSLTNGEILPGIADMPDDPYIEEIDMPVD